MNQCFENFINVICNQYYGKAFEANIEKYSKINLHVAHELDINLLERTKKRHYLCDFEGIYFTNQQLICLIHFINGLKTRQIAEILGISISTINGYFGQMCRKVHCHSKKQLAEVFKTTKLYEALITSNFKTFLYTK